MKTLLLLTTLFGFSFGRGPAHQEQDAVLPPESRQHIKTPTTATTVSDDANPCGFVIYKQCDSQWADIPLGTSTENTICSAGMNLSLFVFCWFL